MNGHQELIQLLETLESSGWYGKPKGYRRMKKDTFFMLSCKHWTIEEMLEELRELPFFVDPTDFIEDFRNQMDQMACEAKAENTRRIFSIAYDATTDVLDMWICGGRR